jgi:ABC-2 type transport system ATP-binding protein
MLQIQSLVKVYPGPVSALKGVDLEVGEGMFGLLGPNGAGKSTLMKVIAGLLEPTSGEVLLDGVDITAKPAKVWERLGYLPQDFGFYPNLTGYAMLRHLLTLKGVRAKGGRGKLARELLERVHLTHAANRKVKEYSGGMRQRLGIAQAIAGDPRLIVVDEPTAGLDPEERQRFYHLLAELAQERIVLLSTHIVEDVSVLCPRFAVIREGELVAETTPRQAREALQGAMFEGVVERDALEGLSTEHTVTQSMFHEGKQRVRLYSPGAQPPAGFDRSPATLEDAYLVLMRSGGSFLPSREAVAVAAEIAGGQLAESVTGASFDSDGEGSL